METITTCRVCGGNGLEKFFDLGRQPLANALLKNADEKTETYPLSLSRCSDCGLVQLNETIDPKTLFSQYVWVTGTSGTANRFAETFCDELLKRVSVAPGEYVLELASNDGTFLLPFMKRGYNVLGIDPAENIAALARENGVPTDALFWETNVAERVREKRGMAKTVFARNVLPHVANTRDFVQGIASVLAPEGIAALEVHYAKLILEELHYDSIYHEHLCYFTLKTLERLLNDAGLFIFDMMRSPISGGSIVVYTRKTKDEEGTEVKKCRQEEERGKVNDAESWREFAARACEHREKFLKLLRNMKSERKKVVGWGASARSSTLLNFCGIGTDMLESIADKNVLKQGRFTAGTRIPIRDPETVMRGNPDVVCILAWNFADEIIADLRDNYAYRGKCVVPLPREPRVV